MGIPWETSHGMGWDRHKLLWDGNGTDKYVPWTNLAISDVIMLFCPLLDDGMLCRIGVVDEKCGLTVLVLVNAQSILHIVFQLYDILRLSLL